MREAECMEKKVKITIVGIGGVGGYLSGMLAKTYENVTLVARGERKKSLEKEGIRLHSQYHGEITARAKKVVESGQEIREVQDFIFLCVKSKTFVYEIAKRVYRIATWLFSK